MPKSSNVGSGPAEIRVVGFSFSCGPFIRLTDVRSVQNAGWVDLMRMERLSANKVLAYHKETQKQGKLPE